MASQGSTVGEDVYLSVEDLPEGGRVRLTSGDDTCRTDALTDATIYAGAGDDMITTSGTGNSVYGQSGDDYFYIYYDLLLTQEKNVYNGGSGRDTIFYEVYYESYDGIVINLDKKVAYNVGHAAHKDHVIGFEDVVGSEWQDQIIGSAVSNVLSGGSGADIIKGLGGNDILYGDSIPANAANALKSIPYNDEHPDRDRLVGGAGKDILVGQYDADVLEGGSGADTFRYLAVADSTPDERDVIKDFRSRQHDKIDLVAIDADQTVSGNQAFDFIGIHDFSGTAGELRYRSGLLSGDVDGDGHADFQIKFQGVHALSASDILL